MKALLLVAHGSRRIESNDEVAALAQKLALKADGEFAVVSHAFLELSEPSIPAGIEHCLSQGAKSVTVLPYFLARGTHVVEDIPEQVAIKQREYPDADIHIVDYLGTADELVDLLFNLATG